MAALSMFFAKLKTTQLPEIVSLLSYRSIANTSKTIKKKECTTLYHLTISEQTKKLDVANSQYKVLLLPGILPKLEHAFGPQQARAKEFQNDDDTIEVFP